MQADDLLRISMGRSKPLDASGVAIAAALTRYRDGRMPLPPVGATGWSAGSRRRLPRRKSYAISRRPSHHAVSGNKTAASTGPNTTAPVRATSDVAFADTSGYVQGR